MRRTERRRRGKRAGNPGGTWGSAVGGTGGLGRGTGLRMAQALCAGAVDESAQGQVQGLVEAPRTSCFCIVTHRSIVLFTIDIYSTSIIFLGHY